MNNMCFLSKFLQMVGPGNRKIGEYIRINANYFIFFDSLSTDMISFNKHTNRLREHIFV